MITSMTGYGAGFYSDEHCWITCEVSSVNHRYFRLSLRAPDYFNALSPRIESLVRERLARGSLTVNLSHVDLDIAPERLANLDLAKAYHRALTNLAGELGVEADIDLLKLLELPGVMNKHPAPESNVEKVWPAVQECIQDAINDLVQMRAREGENIHKQLVELSETIGQRCGRIRQNMESVVQHYRERLQGRLESILEEHGVSVDDADLCREVAIFAERCDVAEELTRLESHLKQVGAVLGQSETAGRRLEFIAQEMFREANTLGSKISDGDLSYEVVELKTAIEKFREQALNVE